LKLQSLSFCCLALILVALPAVAIAAEGPTVAIPAKKASTSGRLLLPFFLVDTTSSDGTNTFFSVRNTSSQAVDILVSYYASDRPANPFHTEPVTLTGKRLLPFSVATVPNLVVDGDGFARGFAIIETIADETTLYGDYFQLTPNEGFASGFRLPNIDPDSLDNDLCSVHSIRFLSGGVFDDTQLTFWFDAQEAPDPDTPVASYAVYSEAGGDPVFVTEIYSEEVAFQRAASALTQIIPTPRGALEIQLEGTGYVAATLSALGLYSVGIEATCLD
jgi:hypothetical protein